MKNIYREYLYIPKDKHISTKVFTTHVVLSVISVLACTLAMFATSYAWFSVEVSSEMNTIAAANYDLRIEGPASVEEVSAYEFTATLATDDIHVYTLYYNGTAKHGFCAVHVDGETYYTNEIGPGEHLKLAIRAADKTTISFQPMWGEPEYFVETDTVRLYGEVYEEAPVMMLFSLFSADAEAEEVEEDAGKAIPGPRTPSKEYQFPQYGTLEDIAAFYEIEVDDILIFNGIDDHEDIEIGDWIDLPYVDEDAELFVPTPPDIEHIVQEGETIESIAAQYDISIEELVEYNKLEPVEIRDTETIEETAEPNVSESEEVEQTDEIEVEPDINELYPLTPGDTIWIPFEATSGYTPSDAVHEEDLPAKEPEEVWTENIISEGVLSSGEPEQLSETEEEPVVELPSGILTVDGAEESSSFSDAEETPVTENPEEQPSGILTPVS